MSNQLFTVHTHTPWDGKNSNQLVQVRLLSLKSVFESFPVIEKKFFGDLVSHISNNNHYTWNLTIKRIVGPDNEDYDTSKFSFVWAMDDQNRMFQFLFQKVGEGKEVSQGVLVALAPPELAKLFVTHEKSAIIRTLSLLNNPNKIKFLMVLGPKEQSLVKENQLFNFSKNDLEKLKQFNHLKNMPNIQGQWFPTVKLRCSVCNNEITMVQNYSIVGVGNIVCPRCGQKKMANTKF